MTAPAGRMDVEEVRFFDGIVHHIGRITGEIGTGDTVTCTIDEERRHLSSRLHTAGHLIDEAVNNLGITWPATKGCHFPGEASVEYEGQPDEGRDYANEIETELNKLIQQGFETKAFFAKREDLESLCHFVLPDMPADKPTRVVIVWGDKGIPCGGTHVRNISEVGPVTIRKFKAKKGVIRVSYELA